MNITNQIYMGAEAAMSNALAGVSRPNELRDFSSYFVLHYCSLFCSTDDITCFKDERVNEVPPTSASEEYVSKIHAEGSN
jgi:hypothetical protein